MSGRKPATDHFKIFGYIAYAHIHDERRKKLEDKSLKCVFLGVCETSKAYKLYDPLTKKVVMSRDVIFEEKKTWKWEEKVTVNQHIHMDLEEEVETLFNLWRELITSSTRKINSRRRS